MSADTLPDDPTYVFCLEPETDDDAPCRILILVEDMTVAVPTALVALTLADGIRLCDRLNEALPRCRACAPKPAGAIRYRHSGERGDRRRGMEVCGGMRPTRGVWFRVAIALRMLTGLDAVRRGNRKMTG